MPTRDWVENQLRDAGVTPLVGAFVLQLLERTKDWGYTENERQQAVELFSTLYRGVALARKKEKGEVWQAGRPGRFTVRDTVRVKAGAYPGPAGETHNGRQGVIVAIRHGDIIVKYEDGKSPEIKDARHSPYSLEKRL